MNNFVIFWGKIITSDLTVVFFPQFFSFRFSPMIDIIRVD
jgi:hypothetical protein